MKRQALYRRDDGPLFFILCGLPFSGKTHLSNKIAECLRVAIISFDSIHEELKRGHANAVLSGSDIWTQVKQIALARLSEALKAGSHVVWDSTNPLRRYRTELIAIGNILQARSVVIHLNPPIIDIYARLERERYIHENFTRKLTDLEETLQIWEDPLADEYTVQITSEVDVIRFIADLRSSLRS